MHDKDFQILIYCGFDKFPLINMFNPISSRLDLYNDIDHLDKRFITKLKVYMIEGYERHS